MVFIIAFLIIGHFESSLNKLVYLAAFIPIIMGMGGNIGTQSSTIVVRGLAPTFNTISVGGDKLPATDLDDRSVDLSMISPEILEGIEVKKALTPDQDADAFGGTVNFILADAPEGGFKYSARFQQSYNAIRDEYGLYKGNMIFSNRLVENKGYRIAEIPIDYRARLGEKKLSPKHGFTIFKRILTETI